MTDYDQLALRSFDHPLDADEQAAMRVWGDALETAGDPRGALIAMECAIRDRPDRRHAMVRAMTDHLVEHGSAWIGAMAPLTRVARAFALEVRSGLLYGVFVDTRRLAQAERDHPVEAVKRILSAPAAKTLRRLHVRVRTRDLVSEVLALLAQATYPPWDRYPLPLEEIVVCHGVRATRLGMPPLGRNFVGVGSMPSVYRRLRLLQIGDHLTSLPFSERPAPRLAEIIGDVTAPSDPVARTFLGRALTHPDPEVRGAAIARVAHHGRAAFMFRDTLLALLGPGMPAPQAELAACLAMYGEHARSAIRPLAVVTGRTSHYDADTRRAAGVAVAALRA